MVPLPSSLLVSLLGFLLEAQFDTWLSMEAAKGALDLILILDETLLF
jgi:hypothetical protein